MRRALATPTTLPFHPIRSNFDRLGPQQNLRETPVARQVAAQQQQSKVHRSASAQPIRSINPIRPQLHIRESVNANMLQIRRVLDSPEGRTSLSFAPDASQIFPRPYPAAGAQQPLLVAQFILNLTILCSPVVYSQSCPHSKYPIMQFVIKLTII